MTKAVLTVDASLLWNRFCSRQPNNHR